MAFPKGPPKPSSGLFFWLVIAVVSSLLLLLWGWQAGMLGKAGSFLSGLISPAQYAGYGKQTANNDGTGRPQYGSCLNEARRFVVATDSRQSTSRGQARHTETAASSPVRSVAATASRVTSSAVWATGVAAVAGSPGQPLPGGTGDAKASPVSGCGSVGTTPG